jgi:hypothetical protein
VNDTARHLRRLLLPLAIVGVAIGVAFYVLQSAPAPVVAPSEPLAVTPTAPAPTTYAAWVRHERLPENVRTAWSTYFIDALLGHQVFRVPPAGLPSHLARALLLDDDGLLFPRGRRLWNRELLYQPGMVGTFCYVHSTYCLKRLFEVQLSVDGGPSVIYDNQYRIERFPSHTTVRYLLGGVAIDEHKFITDDDRAVAVYSVQSRDGAAHQTTIEALVPYPPIPESTGAPQYPVVAQGKIYGTPLTLSIEAPGFERAPTQSIHLQRTLTVPADGSAVSASIAYRFAQGDAPATSPLGASPLEDHVRAYHRWFADNVPYFDAPDPDFKTMWFYRWWIVRYHLSEPRTPDLPGYAFYEGMLGFDNVIGFAVPAQLKELTYLRDPQYAVSQVESAYRNRSADGAVLDAPSSPYWGETYSHWIAMAVAELHQVQPLALETLRKLLPAMAADVRAWLTAYDRDRDGLPERDRPRVTGYDLDILSYWHFNGLKVDPMAEPPALERADFASFVFANARAVAQLARVVADAALALEFDREAERIRAATLARLWDDETAFFQAQQADTDVRIPVRELHGFFPFMAQLAPNEPRYVRALAALVDPGELWARYPPVITSQVHYRNWTWEMDGMTRNIAPHPISMGARTLLQVLRHYDQSHVTPEHFMHLMARYNDLVYPRVHPNEPTWRPNVHEYYSQWEPHRLTPRPKPSDISHDFHSMYCSLIVEGVVGFTPRGDDKIELRPLARQWPYFLLDRLRYRGHDLTIIWDRPDGDRRYASYPEGFSLARDGQLLFTLAALDHVVYDPLTEAVATGAAANVSDEERPSH